MTRVLICVFLMASLLLAGDDQGKPEKVPDVVLEDVVVMREGGQILIDGVALVKRVEPLEGLMVKIDILAPGEQLISERRIVVTKQPLETGDSVPFSLACRDQARAVAILIDIHNARKMPLQVENPGPYPIE
mgnify:CR=1 FL=1